MVDLQWIEPGLAESHPWLELSRWGMAWRAGLGILASGLGIILVMTLVDLGTSDPKPELIVNLAFVGAPPLVVFMAVAAGLGPWLRRFYPFSQALLFGGIGIGITVALTGAYDLAVRIIDPASFGFGLVFVSILAGFPLFLSGAIGYGLAIWSVTRRGARVFWPALALVITLYGTIWVVARVLS